MAGWRLGYEICRRLSLSRGFVEVVLIFFALCLSVPTKSLAQEGFLSIDCGYVGGNYTDTNTNVTWTGDETYMTVGNSSYPQPASNSAAGGSKWLLSFRSFPDTSSPLSRNKYCYELPTLGINYLIRASFYLNETMLKERRPFEFSLFLGGTKWFTLTSGDDSFLELFAVEEAIFHPTKSDATTFCLQPVTGAPFISSLELRELDDELYYNSGGEYLVLLFRLNLGATNTTPLVRSPDDKFDRIWQPAIGSDAEGERTISSKNPPGDTSNQTTYYVPSKVMQDGWLMNYTSNDSYVYGPSFVLYSQYLPVYITPSVYSFAIIYYKNLDDTDSTVYPMNITIDGDDLVTTFTNQTIAYPKSDWYLTANTIQISLGTNVTLGDGPTMNAVEVYGQYDFNFSSTYSVDVDAIRALKESLNLSDWQGDPCVPVPHDWLSCSITPVTSQWYYTDYQTVEKPCGFNTSSVIYCPEQQGSNFLATEYAVTTLMLSGLSTNDLPVFTNASANVSNTFLPLLVKMSLTHSGVTSETFELLLQNFLYWLEDFVTLDLSYNAIVHIPSDWYAVQNLTSLDLSHNQIAGVMSSFEYAPLQRLNLSYNELSSLPSVWNNTVSELVFLDLSYNQLQGEVSSLDSLVRMNNDSLQELYISNNNLNGSLSSSIYFSELTKLTTAIFDQNNIQGHLDLSLWYTALMQKATGSEKLSANNYVHRQLFSFVNNSISEISPSAETIKSAVDMVNNVYSSNLSGILLGGNPYCNKAKSYGERYLCRYSLNDIIDEHHKSSSWILIVSILGGFLALMLSTVTSAILWKLWKQVYALRAIQQALAERKVQPPFFQYNDLKLATHDFHDDKKLGHGSFGTVYKGVLPDETSLAVKKLFPSKRSQARNDLDEFLNEVVLITGIKHRNLVQLKGCCIKDKQRMLVFEYVQKGNLADALWGPKLHGGLNWEQRFNICVGVARGLSYLHEELQPSIIHRDIKPENILLDQNFQPKIADFGLARYSSNETNEAHYTVTVAGTLGYFSPEYASEGQLSEKADVYSYGIVVLEIISGRKCINRSLPFGEVFLKDWVRKMHIKGMLFEVLHRELRDICVVDEVIRATKVGLLCVQNSPESRPSMSQVVTMLLGSTDVNVTLDESDDSHINDFKGILDAMAKTGEYSTLDRLVEDDDCSALNPNAQSSDSTYGRSSLKPLIELSYVQAR